MQYIKSGLAGLLVYFAFSGNVPCAIMAAATLVAVTIASAA